jgi:hypothetical protein
LRTSIVTRSGTNLIWLKPEQAARLTAFWGDESWRAVAYDTSLDFFEHPTKTDNETIVEAFRKRLADVAGFRYVLKPMPMRNRNNAVVYYLIFATPNATADKIVRHIFNGHSRGRVRNWRASNESGLGTGDSGSLPISGCSILLQAMGRRIQKTHRPDPGWQDLARTSGVPLEAKLSGQLGGNRPRLYFPQALTSSIWPLTGVFGHLAVYLAKYTTQQQQQQPAPTVAEH